MLAPPRRPPKRGVINEALSGSTPWVALNLCCYLLPCQRWQWWTRGRQLATPQFITKKKGKQKYREGGHHVEASLTSVPSSSHRSEWWRNDGVHLSPTRALMILGTSHSEARLQTAQGPLCGKALLEPYKRKEKYFQDLIFFFSLLVF